MNDSEFVGGRQRFRHLHAIVDQLANRQWPAVDDAAKRLAIH